VYPCSSYTFVTIPQKLCQGMQFRGFCASYKVKAGSRLEDDKLLLTSAKEMHIKEN